MQTATASAAATQAAVEIDRDGVRAVIEDGSAKVVPSVKAASPAGSTVVSMAMALPRVARRRVYVIDSARHGGAGDDCGARLGAGICAVWEIVWHIASAGGAGQSSTMIWLQDDEFESS